MKKALQLATKANMIDQFNIGNIEILQKLGYSVDVIADFSDPGTITLERANDLKKRLNEMGVRVIDLSIPRSLNLISILKAYLKIRRIISEEHYEIIHCHSPIGGAICRLAASAERNKRTKVIYTAHGFHFYKGAPIINWLVYYPIEKYLSKKTDILITINKEDYYRVKGFKAKKTLYIPGVGVDTKKYKRDGSIRNYFRNELEIGNDSLVLLSVGELNRNKNHSVIIKALPELKDVVYVLCGKGPLKHEYEILAERLGVKDRLIMVGYQPDIVKYYDISDIFVFPSLREGLPVSVLEAMSCGLPCVVSKIRGNTDLIDEEGGVLFDPKSEKEALDAISSILKKDYQKMGNYNQQKSKAFDISVVSNLMEKIYRECQDNYSVF